MQKHTAVIAGASGLIGRRLAEHLEQTGQWNVIRLSRTARADGKHWVGVELADAADCKAKLGSLKEVSHIFYAARSEHPEGVPEPVERNTDMLANLVDALERSSPLRHVHAVHGSKYYGHMQGPVPVPITEDAPRGKLDNYYFHQEDFLKRRADGARWTWSTTRPHCFCDPAIDTPRSIGLVIACYAAVQRELGLPLDFPGSETAYTVRTQFTDLRLLARALAWMVNEPRCANQAFNLVNGDTPTWQQLWAGYAGYFGVKLGGPREFSLAQYLADQEGLWSEMARKHNLQQTRLHELMLPAYGDYQFRPQWEVVSSMAKARGFGFTEGVDSARMFREQFDNYRSQKIIV